MKRLSFLLILLINLCSLFAERVSVEDAALVANNFMRAGSSNSNVKKAVPAKRMVLKANASVAEPQYYVYENADGEGWVIIAANDAVTPVLAFSETGHFRTDNMPENIKHWLGNYDHFIKRIEKDGVEASEEAQAEWNRLRKGVRKATEDGTVVVGPLIKTTWDEVAPFNNFCPGSGSNKAYAGCVAVAMAQVMNFWQWPSTGQGSHDGINFASTTYDWANMKNNYSGSYTTAQANAVATLTYHCGVGTEMLYSNEGSKTYTINYGDWTTSNNAQNALYTYFGYRKPTSYMRNGYTDEGVKYYDSWTSANWIAMLKDELDKQHPIIYGGTDKVYSSGEFTFICDGYRTDDYFHFNWGWSGDYDGYYQLSRLKPGSGGAGGESYDFSENQYVIIGIVPNGYSISYNVDSTMGYVDGPTSALNESITFSAIPNCGYHFVRWSDGNTDNPRTIVVTQDTTLTAEFALNKSGQCGDKLYWEQKDRTLTITGSGDMYDYTANTQPWLLLRNDISQIIFSPEMTSIGEYAFKGLTKIKQINVPNEVVTIGTHAFDSCIFVTTIYLGYQVEEIGDYAFKGCIRVNDITSMNTTTPVVYENTLTSISSLAYLYIPMGSKRTYQLDPYWSRFDIKEIGAEDSTLPKDSVIVVANDDNAIFTWPTDAAAGSYTLQITKDSVVFCTLVFNENGQLIGIAFAPSRDGTATAPAATLSVAGMSFTVTGLNSVSKYGYSLTAADDNNNELVTYRGEFATTGYEGEVNPGGEPERPGGGTTDIDQLNVQSQMSNVKYIKSGQLFIRQGDKIYNAQGARVE